MGDAVPSRKEWDDWPADAQEFREVGQRMIILPAIDIKDGRCVRLYQGDYAQVTTYDTDPVQVAQNWQSAGASWLHVVDLDGAAAGHPVNIEIIEGMRTATSLRIELG